MTYALSTLVSGAPQLVADPLSGRPIAFAEFDLAQTAAYLLAQHGFGGAGTVELEDEADVQLVSSDEEALKLVQLLAADLRLRRRLVARAASQN